MKNWLQEHKKSIILSTAVTLLPMAMGCILWDHLPETMAVHWGADGAVDGFGTKHVAVFLLPAILAVMNLLCMVITAADPKQNGQNKKALNMVFWIMPLISLVACGTVYAVSMGMTLNMFMLMPLLFGALFFVIGNYLPKVKQNSTLGIKIFWTLQNEENWNKTHRFAGKLWVISGVVMLAAVFFPIKWMIAVMLVFTLVIVLVPVLYSYSIYKAHKTQGVVYAVIPKTKAEKRMAAISVVLVTTLLVGVAALMVTGDITYTCGEDALQIEASYDSGLVLSYSDVDTVELREDFDMGMRVVGFASARLSLGTFQNEELQDYTLYAYNSCDSMILICSGDKYLAFNAKTAEETQNLYESLLERIAK